MRLRSGCLQKGRTRSSRCPLNINKAKRNAVSCPRYCVYELHVVHICGRRVSLCLIFFLFIFRERKFWSTCFWNLLPFLGLAPLSVFFFCVSVHAFACLNFTISLLPRSHYVHPPRPRNLPLLSLIFFHSFIHSFFFFCHSGIEIPDADAELINTPEAAVKYIEDKLKANWTWFMIIL